MPDTIALPKRTSALLIASSLTLALGACAGMQGSSTNATSTTSSGAGSKSSAAPSYQPVSDIPIPAGTKINTDKSLILGQDDNWVGKMVLVTDRTSTQTYTYYQDQMPNFGWHQISGIQGKTGIMTFTRADRAAMLEITPGTLSGSEVAITVSPRQGGAGAASMPEEKK